jgi:hypothetical protein
LNDSTDARANCKGLAGPLKGALLRVIDALLDEVLSNLGCSLLRALDTALGTGPSNAVYNTADCVSTEYTKKADRDQFCRTDNRAESGGLCAFFCGGVFCACALTSLASARPHSQTRCG